MLYSGIDGKARAWRNALRPAGNVKITWRMSIESGVKAKQTVAS